MVPSMPENGTLKTDFQLDETAPGMLSANLVVKVFEPVAASALIM